MTSNLTPPILIPVDVKTPPTEEGRYLVSNGLGKFEVNYNEEYGFHDEFTDCSLITHWYKPIELPKPNTIRNKAGKLYPGKHECKEAYKKGAESIVDLLTTPTRG
jgi:hypothetical protein